MASIRPGAVATKPKLRKRIVADVPEHIHKQVRLRCMVRKILVKDYILELLLQDGIKE
jgi:hypothetical protein